MPLAAKDARARFAPLVAHVAREWRRAVDGRLQVYGLTEATWLPLLRIARSEAPMRQNELAASLSLDGSSVVRLLDALENSGLIERCEDHADRRAKSLVLTPRGRRTVDQVERVSQDIRDVVLGEVSDEDLARSLHLLETVRDRLASLADARSERPSASGRRPDEPRSPPRRPALALGAVHLQRHGRHAHLRARAARRGQGPPRDARRSGADDQSLHSGIGRRPIGLRAGVRSLWPSADAAGWPLHLHDRERRRALRPRYPYAHPRALFPGCRRMFGAGARPRHHPRHVAGARGRAALGAHQFAGDGRPRGRSADRRGAQQPLGVANDLDGAERARRRQLRPGVAHSAGDPSGGALRQRLALCPRLFRPAALAAISGLRHRRRLRDDLALCVHRLRAVSFSSIGCMRRAPAWASISRCLFPGSGLAVFSRAS